MELRIETFNAAVSLPGPRSGQACAEDESDAVATPHATEHCRGTVKAQLRWQGWSEMDLGGTRWGDGSSESVQGPGQPERVPDEENHLVAKNLPAVGITLRGWWRAAKPSTRQL
jgi:hypothetical protein